MVDLAEQVDLREEQMVDLREDQMVDLGEEHRRIHLHSEDFRWERWYESVISFKLL